MLSPPETVFAFVAFVVVANLVSKHLAMNHERAMKFGEDQKGSWANGSFVIFLVSAVLAPALIFLWVSVGIPTLSNHELLFTFIAVIVLANLISKHFTMKHELALKHGKPPKAPVVQKHQQKKAGMSYVMKVAILFAISSLVPLALSLLFFIGSPSYHAAFDVAVDVPHPFPPASISSWTEDLPFDADQYPSIEACAAPLARQIVEDIRKIHEVAAEATAKEKAPPTHSTPLRISHSGFSDSDFDDFEEALKEAFKSLKPSVFVANGEADNTRFVSFRLKNLKRFEDAFPSKTIKLKSGEISFRWSKLHGNVLDLSKETKTVSFIEKPWLTSFERFTSRYPESRFYVGAPTSVQPLKSKAHQRAVQDIANRLHLKAEQIEPQIAGKFTQTIERPYGKVYREAILVQNPPLNMAERIASNIEPNVNWPVRGFQSRSPPSFEFSLAMLVCLTVVAGFISNVVTQGYYRTGISRTVMIVAAVSAILIILIVVTTVA